MRHHRQGEFLVTAADAAARHVNRRLAGAIVDVTTADRAAALGLDPRRFLDNNDSYHFFGALDDLLRTGPTGTNVGDVQVALIG